MVKTIVKDPLFLALKSEPATEDDRQVVDGTVNGLSSAVVGGGDTLSKVQTGHVQDYSSLVLLGVSVLAVLFLIIAAMLGGF